MSLMAEVTLKSAVDVDGFSCFYGLAGVVGLGVGGEITAADVGAVIAQRGGDGFAKVRVLASEFGRLRESKAEQIVNDEDLAVAIRASADADRGNTEFAGDPGGEVSRDRLKHDRESACGFHRAGVTKQLFGGVSGFALDAIAAERMERLRS